MKKKTILKHSQIANEAIYYIYKHIDTNIDINQLSCDLGVSRFHFHRLFKEQMGMNIYESIKSIRLQKASTLLSTNKSSTITEITRMCGYSSQTSFILAFKERFGQTPKMWRNGGYKKYSDRILSSSPSASASLADFADIVPKIVKTDAKKVYYIRHRGYNKEVIWVWQKMISWVYTNELEDFEQVGIYYDNPIITPLDKCFYVAGIIVKESKDFPDSSLQSFELSSGLYATFDVEGKYGDILKLIQWAYHYWLPNSGFETTPDPSYTIFEKNHYLENDGKFKAKYYVPVRFV